MRSRAETVLPAEVAKGILLGLYLGLSLLLIISWLDPDPKSNLRFATNIYGVQALAGAILGFWRIWNRRADPRTTPAVVSVWICAGLLVWTIGQALWTWGLFRIGSRPYAWWADVFYLASDLFWLIAIFKIYTWLSRSRMEALTSFSKVLIPVGVSLIVTTLPALFVLELDPRSGLLVNAVDLAYILITVSSVILAIGLLVGNNLAIPFPLHQCIRYLCLATAVDAIAVLAFTITLKLKEGHPLAYSNGNLVDWLFLTAMYFWGASALKWPIRKELLQYTFQTARLSLFQDEIYRAVDIARRYSPPTPLANVESLKWIRENIPNCWRVVKLGNVVVGSTFVFPVSRAAIKYYKDTRKTSEDHITENVSTERERFKDKLERQLFNEVQSADISWECLYLAEASILPRHRRRGLAFKSFSETIDDVASRHPDSKIEVFYWPEGSEENKLFEKLREHFKDRIPIKKIIE